MTEVHLIVIISSLDMILSVLLCLDEIFLFLNNIKSNIKYTHFVKYYTELIIHIKTTIDILIRASSEMLFFQQPCSTFSVEELHNSPMYSSELIWLVYLGNSSDDKCRPSGYRELRNKVLDLQMQKQTRRGNRQRSEDAMTSRKQLVEGMFEDFDADSNGLVDSNELSQVIQGNHICFWLWWAGSLSQKA